jgi:hypothetical protein
MAIEIASRPANIDGCFQTLKQTTVENIIRSNMEGGTIKVRRRSTAFLSRADASVTLKAEQFDDFLAWYKTACQGGILPTRFKFPPDNSEQVWRFASPPEYEWITNEAFRVSFQIEQLPEWVGL